MAKKKTTVLRELLGRRQILFRPTVANALQAKMVEKVGFEALSISGVDVMQYNFLGKSKAVTGLHTRQVLTLIVINHARNGQFLF